MKIATILHRSATSCRDGLIPRLSMGLTGITLVFVMNIVSGCSSSDGDAAGPVAENETLVATFSSIRSQVLGPNCAVSGCHSGASAPFDLSMDVDVAYTNLVNVMSGQQPDVVRVAPGDPDNSYLIQKLEGTAAKGVQMPRNQEPLPTATIQIIRQWIANGALDT